jgi:uncharacterized protein (DUF58 family)
MLVMFGDRGVLMLGLVDSDIETLRDGRTLEYINPPHRPQLVKDIVVFKGKDREAVIALIRSAGVNFTEAMADKYRRGERTDRGHQDH